MAGQELMLSGNVEVRFPDGSTGLVPAQYASSVAQATGGGQMSLGQMGDVALGVYDAFSADSVKRSAKRARKRRKELEDLQAEYLKIDAGKTAERDDKLDLIWQKQRELDKAQTRALEKSYKSMLVNALAAGGRVLAPGTGAGMGLGFGNQALLAGMAGFGVGAILFGDDDDEDDDE